MSTTSDRVSQRAPRSCQPCTRRKLKCSKQIPCSNCVSRGTQSECRRESVILSKHAAKTYRPRRSGAYDSSSGLPLSPASQSNGLTETSLLPEESHTSRDEEIELTIASSLIVSPPANNPEVRGIATASSIPPDHEPGGSTKQQAVSTEAVNSLESLIWGSHLSSGTSERSILSRSAEQAVAARSVLSVGQEEAILRFHQDYIAWLHNVVHVASFAEECINLRWAQTPPSIAWQSLYYAMMSVGLFYMKDQACIELGILDKATLTKTFYRKALDALRSSDFMAVHSLNALQAICVLVPCAYAFGDSKRIIVLLSSATCIAQLMRINTLDTTLANLDSAHALLEHEIKKRVWYFLVIQDSYLTTFKGTYNIVLAHAKTPLPTNCPESLGEFLMDGKVQELPLSIPTQSTYMILQVRLTGIKRKLHDDFEVGRRLSVTERYQKVLEADEDLAVLRQELPPWMKTRTCSMDAAPFVRHQWRTFRISYAHMKLTIHRTFFCHSFKSKQFNYSHQACLDAARMLLLTYHETAAGSEFDSWTVPAHVISASLIIAMEIVLRDGGDDFDPHVTRALTEDKDLMLQCLELVAAGQSSLLVKRGLALIYRLLADKEQSNPTYSSFDGQEIAKLVREVEDALTTDEAATTAYNLTFEEFLDMLGDDPFTFVDNRDSIS